MLVVIDDDISKVRIVKSLGFLPQSIISVNGGLVGAASMVTGAVMAMARARVVRWLAWLLRSGIALLARMERANLVLIVRRLLVGGMALLLPVIIVLSMSWLGLTEVPLVVSAKRLAVAILITV